MKTDLLLRQTRMHFPRFDDAEVEIHPIEKGGSDRKFYRVRFSPDQTIILVKYNLEREENRHYVEIAEIPGGEWNSRAQDLFSRSGRRPDLDRRSRRTRSV